MLTRSAIVGAGGRERGAQVGHRLLDLGHDVVADQPARHR